MRTLIISVTIQPRGAPASTSPKSSQSTAQFASSLVTGTLKRAIGTVADTVTSFVTGKDSNPTVVYDAAGSADHAQVHVIVPEVVVSVQWSSVAYDVIHRILIFSPP